LVDPVRHCEERSDAAIHEAANSLDCCASLAMTNAYVSRLGNHSRTGWNSGIRRLRRNQLAPSSTKLCPEQKAA
jgi:hypothetical protein